ncbi:MAG: HEAT repeat domain-containing protein [bacterium]|nr:HEAT repeat domain-containing protein [bacterium]
MARKKKHRRGMNAHQKKAHKIGENRIRWDEIPHYLELAESDNPKDRLEAAANLCPCHVRKPIPEVQQALYRLMEDPDPKVRDRAFHTLEDGGIPNDLQIDAILERALQSKTDGNMIREHIPKYVRAHKHKERTKFAIAARSEYNQTGKCDFCGQTNVKVKTDFDTEIPESGHMRFALICESCDPSNI